MTSRWIEVSPASPPTRGDCVYVIYVDGEIQYVGKGNSAAARVHSHKRRLRSHFADRSIRVKVSFNRKYGENAMRELRLIAKLHPYLNKRDRRGFTWFMKFPLAYPVVSSPSTGERFASLRAGVFIQD